LLRRDNLFLPAPLLWAAIIAAPAAAEQSAEPGRGEGAAAELTVEQREEACISEQLVVAPADTTLQEMRAFCASEARAEPSERAPRPVFSTVPETEPEPADEPRISERAEAIRDAASNPFTLASHKTNYLLPLTYNPDPNKGGFEDFNANGEPVELDPVEVQFQLSVQVPVWRGFLGKASFMSVAYTNRSFWQAYNSDDSSPFRETNHEPELIMTWLNDWSLLGFRNVANQVAVNHQSNGRSEPLSRSWNRVYANFIFERENYFFSFKPWYRIPEKAEDDDNPDIEDYLGYFELTGGYRGAGNKFSVLLRNNLQSQNRGAVELRWGFPIGNRVRGYVKYFNGYGESLIDYNESVQTLGIGFELAQGF